ncbi:MAG: undecaprenyl-diphosphatase UppP [Thermodesulfobacteriota bacterium]
MNMFYAILLGFLQGATEFLPISSSGHLVLAEYFLGLEEVGLSFDVALHLGTLLAILAYFRRDFLLMARSLLFAKDLDEEGVFYRKLAVYIVLATIPGVMAGLFLNDLVETLFRQPVLVATTLGIVGLLLLWAEKAGKKQRDIEQLGLTDALIIGVAQALAVVPGVSRSGITMTAGLFAGFNRQAAARFSFMLSAPIIFGAGVYHVPEIIKQGGAPGQLGFYLAGFLAAALSGYAFIAWLLKFIRTRTFEIFAYYRMGLAFVVYLALILS